MQYDAFLECFYRSEPSDWEYLDDFDMLWIYKPNIAVTILCPDAVRISHSDADFDEEWHKVYPDPRAKMHKFKFRFNGQLIEEFYAVLVDGGRQYIPLPVTKDLTITSEQYNVGRIINLANPGRQGYGGFDSYLQRAGIRVLQNQP
jgi:hypothetical protein